MRWSFLFLVAIASAASGQQAEPGVRYVFFNWGDGELSGDAKAELEKVASEYSAAPTPLLLDGHSDRSGPAGANVRGSRARAHSVAAYLQSKGIPAAAMTIRAYGESRPIIATEDGVREVQNRRVEVRFVRR